MAKTQLLHYDIYVESQQLVDDVNAQVAAGGGPQAGALIQWQGQRYIYRAPFHPTGGPGGGPGGMAVEARINNGEYLMDGTNDGTAAPLVTTGQFTPPSGVYLFSEWFFDEGMNTTVATFQKSSGWWIFGSSTRFYWAGTYRYRAPITTSLPGTGSAAPPVNSFAQRVYVDGFEILEQGGGDESATADFYSPDASRVSGGLGLAIRTNSASQAKRRQTFTTLQPAGLLHRFYFRPRTFGSAANSFFYCQQAGTAGQGFSLAMDAGGGIGIYYWSSAAASTLVRTINPSDGVMEIGRWYRFDVIFHVSATDDLMELDVYINGNLISQDSAAAGGVDIAQYHSIVEHGHPITETITAEYDIDDCVGMFIPAALDRWNDLTPAWDPSTAYSTGDRVTHEYTAGVIGSFIALQASTGEEPGVVDDGFWAEEGGNADLKYGSAIVQVVGEAFGAGHGTWSGGSPDPRAIMGRFGVSVTENITSNVSGDRMELDVTLNNFLGLPGAVGWFAMTVGLYSTRGSTNHGTLGWDVDGAGDDLDSITQGLGSPSWQSRVLGTPKTLETLYDGDTTLKIIHEKAADTSTAGVYVFGGQVEIIGHFGPEDVEPSGSSATTQDEVTTSRQTQGNHNWNFPFCPWMRSEDALGPVQLSSGTYVGNSLGTTLSFPLPVHFLWVRPTTGSSGGFKWIAPGLGGHIDVHQAIGTQTITKAIQNVGYASGDPDLDQQQEYQVHIGADNSQVNATGVTYAYVAIMDPAGRFFRGGSFGASPAQLPKTVPFEFASDPFTPEWLFFFREAVGTTTTSGFYGKGPGHAAAAIQDLDSSTTVSPGLTFGAGDFTVEGSLIPAGFNNFGYLGARVSDGNNDPGEPGVVKIGTYTGDGSASRTISLAPASGLRPLFAIVHPANGTAYFRDPTHTTNTSHSLAGSSTTTGITAGGIDSFSVGSTLNSNAIVYNYFVLMGSATAGNGGWSIDGDFNPVAADSINPPGWTEPTFLGDSGTSEEEPTILPEQPDLDNEIVLPYTTLFCLDYSTRIVNRALSRAGVSKQVSALDTGQTEEEVVARLHLKDDVEATLRLFPWAFATEYAALVLHSGDDTTPVNQDWQYAYLLPSNCVLPRRLVPQDGRRRKANSRPAAFHVGLDETDGWLVFTNEKATTDCPLQLEYTKRIGCPSYFGDALFKEALVWKLASSFSETLAKNQDRADKCLRMFEFVRVKAETADANAGQQEQGTTSPDAPWTEARGPNDQDADWTRSR